MSARGARLTTASDYLTYIPGGTIFDKTTTDVVVCGWMRIRAGLAAENFVGNWNPIYLGDNNANHGIYVCQHRGDDPRVAANPYQMQVAGYAGAGSVQESDINLAAIDEDWFYAFVYNHGTNGNDCVVTYYYAKDQDSGLTVSTAIDGTNYDVFSALKFGARGDWTGGQITNGDLTNMKVWSGAAIASTFTASSGAALFTEMNSESPVITSGLYGHWKLASGSDLLDYSGNSRTLTAVGSITDGIMDPVDLQGSSSSSCTWYGRLIA